MFPKKLNNYIIPGALPFVNKWCEGYAVHLIIKNARETKLGDYSFAKGRHQITLNYGLDAELSFHILTHEIAHMHARVEFGTGIKPHGIEWKNCFSSLIYETIHLFQPEFQKILKDFAINPRAGYYAYAPMVNYFQQKENPDKLVLQNLKFGDIFKSGNNVFKKGNKRKIRYICTEVKTGKKYSIHPLAPVEKVIKIQK